MSEHEVRAVQRIYAAFSRWDVDEMLSDVSHDFELTLPDPLPFGGTRHGPQRTPRVRTALPRPRPGGFADPDDYLEAGDRLVVLGRLRGRARETGRDYEVPFAHVWAFSDGVPCRCRSYFDSAPIVAALSGPG